jgi:hypothetical protein
MFYSDIGYIIIVATGVTLNLGRIAAPPCFGITAWHALVEKGNVRRNCQDR